MSSKRQSQLTQSQEEVCITNEIVDATVKIILSLDNSKKPIKQSEVLNGLNCNIKRKQHNRLWERSKEKFKGLGMALVDCDSTQFKSFLLVADSQDLSFMHQFASHVEKADRTLLIIILSFIFMKDGMVTDDELFRHLCCLQIVSEETWDHRYFGDVKKKLQSQYVEQLYITRTTVAENAIVELRWGQRAKLEVPMTSVLDFVCKIAYNGRAQPKDFVSQFQKATTLIEPNIPISASTSREN